jgi:hypothetical protein
MGTSAHAWTASRAPTVRLTSTTVRRDPARMEPFATMGSTTMSVTARLVTLTCDNDENGSKKNQMLQVTT